MRQNTHTALKVTEQKTSAKKRVYQTWWSVEESHRAGFHLHCFSQRAGKVTAWGRMGRDAAVVLVTLDVVRQGGTISSCDLELAVLLVSVLSIPYSGHQLCFVGSSLAGLGLPWRGSWLLLLSKVLNVCCLTCNAGLLLLLADPRSDPKVGLLFIRFTFLHLITCPQSVMCWSPPPYLVIAVARHTFEMHKQYWCTFTQLSFSSNSLCRLKATSLLHQQLLLPFNCM